MLTRREIGSQSGGLSSPAGALPTGIRDTHRPQGFRSAAGGRAHPSPPRPHHCPPPGTEHFLRDKLRSVAQTQQQFPLGVSTGVVKVQEVRAAVPVEASLLRAFLSRAAEGGQSDFVRTPQQTRFYHSRPPRSI